MVKSAANVASSPVSGGEVPDFEQLLAKGSFHERLARARAAREKVLAESSDGGEDFILPTGRKPWERTESRPRKSVAGSDFPSARAKPGRRSGFEELKSVKAEPESPLVLKDNMVREATQSAPVQSRTKAHTPKARAEPVTSVEGVVDRIVGLPATVTPPPVPATQSRRRGRAFMGFAAGMVVGAVALALLQNPALVGDLIASGNSDLAAPISKLSEPATLPTAIAVELSGPTVPFRDAAPTAVAAQSLQEPQTVLAAPGMTRVSPGQVRSRDEYFPPLPDHPVNVIGVETGPRIATGVFDGIRPDIPPPAREPVLSRPSIYGDLNQLALVAVQNQPVLGGVRNIESTSGRVETPSELALPTERLDIRLPVQPLPIVQPGRPVADAPGKKDDTVFVHAPSLVGPGSLSDLIAKLNAEGFMVSDPKRVGFNVSQSNVRYYHAADARTARAVAASIGAEAWDFTGYRPSPPVGTIEVWVKGVGQKATKAKPGVDGDRMIRNLRNSILKRLQNGFRQ